MSLDQLWMFTSSTKELGKQKIQFYKTTNEYQPACYDI